MAANLKLGPQLLVAFGEARGLRGQWDANYQDIKELVRPDSGNFNRVTTPGQRRYDNIYDGTAVHACEEFASGLHSYLTSPSERWFEVSVPSIKRLVDYPEAKQWLDLVSDTIYGIYSDPNSGFNPALHEGYLDLGAYGTAAILQEWNYEKQCIVFKTGVLGEMFFEENAEGQVDTVWIYRDMTGRQILEEFSKDGLLQNTDFYKIVAVPANAQKLYKVVRFIGVNTNRVWGKIDKLNKAYASDWVVETTGAGDAFASTVVSALAYGLTTKEALMWGPINSMSVVQQVGAQRGLLSREALEEYLKNAPEDYKAHQI